MHGGDRAIAPHDRDAGSHRPHVPARQAASGTGRTAQLRRAAARARRVTAARARRVTAAREGRGAAVGGGRLAVGVVQPQEVAAGAEHGVHPVPEPAGLPQPAGFRVPDGGDGDDGVPGELRLGQAGGAPSAARPADRARAAAARSRSARGRTPPATRGLALRLGPATSTPSATSARSARRQVSVEYPVTRLSAAPLGAGVPAGSAPVGDLGADGGGHPGPLWAGPYRRRSWRWRDVERARVRGIERLS